MSVKISLDRLTTSDDAALREWIEEYVPLHVQGEAASALNTLVDEFTDTTFAHGAQSGRDVGYDEGHSDGYEEGYDSGYAAAKEEEVD